MRYKLNKYEHILDKLKQFIKKYYGKMLLKGLLLFLVLGLLFSMAVMAVEYFLWLNSTGRLLLLFVFLGVELFLLFRYILTPLFYLFRLKKGISNKQASVLIGKHFPEVGDKLFNLLDLVEDSNRTELLLASIEQRADKLEAVPFVKAVNIKESLRYAKYLIFPIILISIIWVTGNLGSFFGSANRVVHYDLAYEPPAPFKFSLLSEDLEILDSKPYTIKVTTIGEVRPEGIYIVIQGKESLLQRQEGYYQYTFVPPLEQTSFYFMANGVRSRDYMLNVLKAPAIQNFKMRLDYPGYTNRTSEVINSTGNASFPEGTKVSWEILGSFTESILLKTKDTALNFSKYDDRFDLVKTIYTDFPYLISTSNQHVEAYENLEYRFEVIKDAYPSITAYSVLDSLNPNITYYAGEASDDYKLSSIKLVCYPDNDRTDMQVISLATPNSNFDQFYYTFPSGLELEVGTNYSFYFEAIDNDAIHKGKSSKSQIFSMNLLDGNQLRSKELESQQSIIDNLDRSLDVFKEQKEALKEINKGQLEKNQLNFSDQNRIKDFLQKQQQQEQMMQKFSKQLKDNLNKEQQDEHLNQLLRERLERQELEAKKNERLLEELNKIADKLDKEALSKRLEELAKNQQNNERNLEQLLELTKRYYVTEKAAQLAKDLNKLGERQHELTDNKKGEELSAKQQAKLNAEFKALEEELRELEKDNGALKKPLDLQIDKQKEADIEKDQEDALEQLNKQEGAEESSVDIREKAAKTAAQKQKAAAQKIQEMSESLQQGATSGSSDSSVTEDADMLRQILDNLVTFSFKQEKLFERLESADTDAPQFSSAVREQQELRELFEHVDDSLFALSLRQAELSEFVNEQITEVYYNMDKSMESMAESQIFQGVSYQKYVLNASNGLADFLARILDNMQQSMKMGSGSGESSEGFQLPDIIKAQGELKEKMEGIGKDGKGMEGKGEAGKGKSGQGEQEGDGGAKSGKGGKSGEGDAGEEGKVGKGGKDGTGKSGDGGNQDGGQGQGQQSEAELKEIYEIYKAQQQLRENLEKQLQDMINSSDRKLGEKLLRQMEDFENDLLENGITQRGLSKINTIQYELLKLENAALKQGKKEERESNANKNQFNNPITTRPALLENYRNEVEILNRQALPLRQNFQNKVKDYFKGND